METVVKCPECLVTRTAEEWDKTTAIEVTGEEEGLVDSVVVDNSLAFHVCPNCKKSSYNQELSPKTSYSEPTTQELIDLAQTHGVTWEPAKKNMQHEAITRMRLIIALRNAGHLD